MEAFLGVISSKDNCTKSSLGDLGSENMGAS